ncbi:unnamed protein product [Pleuronectes platessa]|uniref:Uncharacterized protein n=1 Tax=Pleuronectes platessa TaxID=8262 RepID=A0A9N7VE35_PLEPL|nr:unnamed protein product [Pleuronectes platessa]
MEEEGNRLFTLSRPDALSSVRLSEDLQVPFRNYPLSHGGQKLLEYLPISVRYPKPPSGLAPSLSKGFAAAAVPIGFKVHRAACVPASALTDSELKSLVAHTRLNVNMSSSLHYFLLEDTV